MLRLYLVSVRWPTIPKLSTWSTSRLIGQVAPRGSLETGVIGNFAPELAAKRTLEAQQDSFRVAVARPEPPNPGNLVPAVWQSIYIWPALGWQKGQGSMGGFPSRTSAEPHSCAPRC